MHIEKIKYLNKKNLRRLFTILISTLSMAAFLFIYGQFQTATLKTITTFNSDFAERVNMLSGALLNNIKTSAMQMFYTSSIKTLRTSHPLYNAQKIIGLRDLGNFVSSSDFLDSVMVYNSRSDTVFTSEGGRSSTKSQDFHDTEAVNILTHPENFPYLTPIKRTTPYRTTYSFLFFEYQNADTSALLVNVSERWYISQLLGISEDNDYIVVDEQGSIIASENEGMHQKVSQSWPKIRQQIADHPSEGFFMPSAFSAAPGWMYHRMDNTGWYYLRPIQLQAIAPGLVYIRNFLVISFLLLGGIFILFTAYLLLKVYVPLQHIRTALSQGGKSSEEISLQVEELVAQRQESIQAQYLSKLYTGTLPPIFLFPVVLITADNCNITDFRKTLEAACPVALTIPTDTGASAAVSSCSDTLLQQLEQQLTAIHKSNFYISNLCLTPDDLIKSHSALEELVKLHFLYPNWAIMSERMLDQCNPVSTLKTKEVSALISALKAGHGDTAFLQWKSIFSCIQTDHYSDFCFALRYIGKQLNILQTELGIDNPLDLDQLLEEPGDANTIHAYVEQLLNLIAESSKQKKQQQLTILSKQVDEFIIKNYSNSSFSSQEVAEHFQMNAAYLSRQYQQITERSISDALNQIRIKQACILLKSTDESAELIAQRVGYNNSKYFFVLFKKWMGITPKQYRNSAVPPISRR